MPHASTAGKLLIATPAIGDGTFEQSVIFMLHHDPAGALGVTINRPSELPVHELLPRWADLASEPSVVFSGGPVEPNGFIGVGRCPGEPAEGLLAVPDTDLVTVDLDSDPALTAAHVDRLRLFRGYSGWGARQLDTELAGGAWFTVDPVASDMWSTVPGELYESVLRRQAGSLRWFANAPLDPTQN